MDTIRQRIDRVFHIFLAYIKAHLWCWRHFGQCILTQKQGFALERLSAGTGSILKGTLKLPGFFGQSGAG